MLFVVQETVALIDDFPQRLEVSFGCVVELFLIRKRLITKWQYLLNLVLRMVCKKLFYSCFTLYLTTMPSMMLCEMTCCFRLLTLACW